MKANKKYYIEEKSPFLHEIKDVKTNKVVGVDNFVAGAKEQIEENGGIIVSMEKKR